MDEFTPSKVMLAFFASFLFLLVVLPMLYPYGTFSGLDGRAGVIENLGTHSSADPLTKAVYALGDLFCHQETGRSFLINGSQMAFCQRDVCILAGMVSGLFLLNLAGGRIRTGDRIVLVIGTVMVLSTFIEWAAESVSGTDILAGRIATGLLAGAGIALILQFAVTRQYEKIMFLEEV